MLKHKKFLIGGIIIFLAIGYLGYTGFNASATYYYTVSEVAAKGDSVIDQNIRVNGNVTQDSVSREGGGLKTDFTLEEGGKSLPVSYEGVVPDNFSAGIEVVIEGHLDSENVFQAHTIMVKCPSKYVPEGEAQ